MQIPCWRDYRKSEKWLNEKVKVMPASGWGEAVLRDLFLFAGRGQLHAAFMFPAMYPVCPGLLGQVCVSLLRRGAGEVLVAHVASLSDSCSVCGRRFKEPEAPS